MHKKRVSLPIKAEFFHSFHGFLCSSSRLTVEDEIVIFNIWFSDAKFLFELCWAHAKCLSDL